MSIMPCFDEKDNSIFKCCSKFVKEFKVNLLLRTSNATKDKGFNAYGIFAFLLSIVFTGKNLFVLLRDNHDQVPFEKDVVYRFLNKQTINWNIFVFSLSTLVIKKVRHLTSEKRRVAYVIDDSPYYRNRSKKVELLSRMYDHAEHAWYRGFNLLTLGWTDGQTFVPVDYRVVASGDDKNLLEESHLNEDRRTLATRRRTDARKEKPALVNDMLDNVKSRGAQAEYVLFDSWFSSPAAIMSVAGKGFQVVTRLKNLDKHHYLYNGESLPISKIYSSNRKRRGRSRYLLSVGIEVKHKDYKHTIPARLVFVRDKNDRKKWIALLSTDTKLTEDEIVALYGKRWDIEPYHKVIKSYLHLENEYKVRSYDSVTAHAAIVMTRYMMLSYESIRGKDDRSVCELFYVTCKELDDISFSFAFELILSTIKQSANEYLHMTRTQINAYVECFMSSLPAFIKSKLGLSVCET